MKSEIPPDRSPTSGAITAEGPTVWSACLALLWCAFLLLACAMATRFDEKRMVQSNRRSGSAGGEELSPPASRTSAPRHGVDIAARRPIQ